MAKQKEKARLVVAHVVFRSSKKMLFPA